MGGWSPEAPISLNSGRNVFSALNPEKYIKRAVILTKERQAILLDEGEEPSEENLARQKASSMAETFATIMRWKAEAALLALHGCGGEDGAFQGFLATLGLPFTHSGVTASAVAMDKAIAKLLYEKAGVRTPRSVVLIEGDDPVSKVAKADLAYPLIAKPNASGSSFGLWLIKTPEELLQTAPKFWEHGAEYLLEEFISGREFTCVVLSRQGRAVAMPVTEIISHTGDLFDFKAKYSKGSSEEITPADIDTELSDRIREAALKCHLALGCRGASRTDFMVSASGRPYALETNTIPGMSAASILPKVVVAAGYTFSETLDEMLSEALSSKDKN